MRRRRSDSKFVGKEQAVVDAYLSGMSTPEIGEKYGVDRSNISRFIAKQGLTRDRSKAMRNAIETGRHKAKCGKESHMWKGGRAKHSKGYILVKCAGHLRCNS